MKKLLGLLLVISSVGAWAQKISIRGQVVDSIGVGLPSATIMVLNPKDSSLVNFAATQPDGKFEIKNLNRQAYLLKTTFVGMAPITQAVNAPATEPWVDVGTLTMTPLSKMLGEVVVEAGVAPVTLKKDTIEFNADAFKSVKQNAVVEDLLKKLPGVEVDADGTIRAQGEQVQRVTVDGKTFFGNDPKLATRNLPADAVNKVQVFDKKSDQATFTGVDDGQREKTINLELKEEKRKGMFGTLSGGVGTDDRFQARANLNKFKKGQQLSFLGMANNVNESGFSIDDYMTYTGGAQSMMSGRGGAVRLEFNGNDQSGVPLNFGGRTSGIMTTYAGGVNFNKELNKKTEINTSYFYNGLQHDLDQFTDRVNYFSTGNLTFNQASRQHNTNANHRVNAMIDHKIDSANSIKFTTSVNYNDTETKETSTSRNTNADGTVANESLRNTTSSGSSATVSASLLYRHKFGKKGRTFSANATLAYTDTDRSGTLAATNTFYDEGATSRDILQNNVQATQNLIYGINLSYTEPLGNRRYLEGNYNFRHNQNDVDRRVYDVGAGEPQINLGLSNQYTSDYQYHRAGLNFRIARPAYNITVGTSMQQTYLKGDLQLLGTTISKSYNNILPVARFNYDFTSAKHLRFDYETSVQEPSLQQLQPVVDNSDPLNVYVGNPDLRPAYAHDWRVNYTMFNPANFTSFFMFADVRYTGNYIATSQTFTEQNVRISKPVNVDHNLRLSGNATVSVPIQKIKSRFNVTANATRESGINVINDAESGVIQQTVGGTVGYNFRYKEIFDASLSANLSRQNTDYEFNEQADQVFFNKTYSAETNLSLLKNYSLGGALEYLVYESLTNDYKQDIPLLNLSVSRYFLKAKSGELKFSVQNVLDKNIGISQEANSNYFQRQTSNSLGRFYMITFTYALNKQLNPMGMRPRGGMIRIQR